MYTILINSDNTMSVTEKQRIIQRSKLVDDFQFLVLPVYNGHDMSHATVLLEYLKPVSKEYKTEILEVSDQMYKEYLVYNLPVDTEFTKEAGELKVQLSFIYVDMDESGVTTQRVRKIAPPLDIDIIPISAWSDIIPDSALTAIDQRLIKMDAQIKAIADTGNLADLPHVDGLAYDNTTNRLQLTADGERIGNSVIINAGTQAPDQPDIEIPDAGDDGDDGFPVVPFNDIENDENGFEIVRF